ncbi:MAG: PAS domain-containing sensor histidine kinase [Parafilimonas sp.]
MLPLQNTLLVTDEDLLYHETLISCIDDVIVSTDKNFRIKTFNGAAEKIYDLTADEAIGRKSNELAFVKYLDSTHDEAIKKLVNENYWKGLIKIITDSGKEFFLQTIITTVRNSEKRKLGYVSVSRDVTADIQNKQSLHNFSSVLTLLEESFLIIDRNYKVVFLRPKGNVQRFFNSDYTVGDHALKYIPETYVDEVKKSYEKAFYGETVHYTSELTKEDFKLYFDVTYTPLKDDAGNVTNVCVIIKDLTAQKEIEVLQRKKAEVEKNLNISRKFFYDFMENTHLLAWIVDKKGFVHYMNSSFADSFKIEKNETGKNISEIYSSDIAQEYFESNRIVIEEGITVEKVEKRFAKNSIPYKIIKFPISFKNELMVACWGIDISEQIAQQDHLTQLNQDKNKIVSVIAHDVYGPLGINANFLDTIIGDYKSLAEEEILKYLKMVKTGISKCYTLSEELLLWARGQLKSTICKPAALDTDIEIIKVIDNLKQVAEEKNIVIETQLCSACKTYADPDMLAIVLRNFISNAIKFSNPNSKITVSTTVDNQMLKISVTDTGVGLKKETIERLNSKLNYESSYGTKGEKGSGLGLIIAKDYIERNNGEMYIESEVGKGSTFSFTLRFVKK